MSGDIHKGPPDLMIAFGPSKKGPSDEAPPDEASDEKKQAVRELASALGLDLKPEKEGEAADALCALIDLHMSESGSDDDYKDEPDQGDEG